MFSNKFFTMEKWLRTGTMKRKANDTADANPNCDTRVVTTSKCDRSTIKVEEAVQGKNTVGNTTVHIWNLGSLLVVMIVNRKHSVFYVMKCCRTSA
jgi:hypothetical protein